VTPGKMVTQAAIHAPRSIVTGRAMRGPQRLLGSLYLCESVISTTWWPIDTSSPIVIGALAFRNSAAAADPDVGRDPALPADVEGTEHAATRSDVNPS